MAMADEVQEAMGRSYGMPDDIDEADLDAGRTFFSCLILLLLAIF